jgi:hypothetical protein
MRSLWLVGNGNPLITVIAESAEDAMLLAIEGGAIEPEDADLGRPAPDEGRRWVPFGASEDRRELLDDLRAAQVPPERIYLREISRCDTGPYLWEIGASDADWCRLDEGVLCGGWS